MTGRTEVTFVENETAASPALTADLASRAPKAEVRRYPIGHFDAYIGEWFERIVSDQIAFLRVHLGLGNPAEPGTVGQEIAGRGAVRQDVDPNQGTPDWAG